MRRLPPVLLGAIHFACAGSAAAGELPPVAVAGDGVRQILFVELVLNGQADGPLVPLDLREGRLLLRADDLRAAGLRVTDDGLVDVSALPGSTARYDAGTQSLLLDASPDLLPRHEIHGEGRARNTTVADIGAMLNYDVYAQRSDGSRSIALWTEQRLFGPFGTLSNTGTLREASGAGAANGYLRYDTRYRLIDESRALALSVGDLITRSLPWGTSVRIGGVQIGRDYHVRPDLVTMPLPRFAGQAAVPSAVDLFVNGDHQQGAAVAPGRFVLDAMPVVNGAGQATIVTTDAVGRQIATVIPFYVTPELLRPGLTDASAEIGFLRRGYGLRSFDYGAATASATARRGMTDRFTIEAHGEATRGLIGGGAGAVWSPGLWGVFDAAIAASRTARGSGAQLTVGYSYTARAFSLSAEHMERGAGYRDLGSVDLVDYRGTRRSDRVVGTIALERQGYVGLAYIDGKTLDGPRTQTLSLSYSRPLRARASLFLSADRDLRRGGTSAQLRLIAPFGRNSLSAGISRDPGRGLLYQADFARAVPGAGGLGLSASAASDQQGRAYGQASSILRTRVTQFEAGTAFADGRSSQWIGATGSLVAMDHALFAANQVSDAFAVISTGAPGVPISYENQPLGVTDGGGRLFVPSVTSYHPGRFALDPLSLAADQAATVIETRVALREGAGALIHLPVKQVRSVTVALVDDAGAPLAAGGRVAQGGTVATIGWDGMVFLPDIEGTAALDVLARDGRRCHATVMVPADAPPLAQIGPVPCR